MSILLTPKQGLFWPLASSTHKIPVRDRAPILGHTPSGFEAELRREPVLPSLQTPVSLTLPSWL